MIEAIYVVDLKSIIPAINQVKMHKKGYFELAL